MSYRITADGPDTYRLEKSHIRGMWPFRWIEWQAYGLFNTEEGAKAAMIKDAGFKPITTYYNRHGEKEYGEVEW